MFFLPVSLETKSVFSNDSEFLRARGRALMLTSVFVCPLSINENWSWASGQGEATMFPWGFHLMEIQCWVGRQALGDALGIKNVIHWTHYHALAGNCNMLCKWPQLCSYVSYDFLKTRLRREVRLPTARRKRTWEMSGCQVPCFQSGCLHIRSMC